MQVLLNPGPVNISPKVRQALSRPDICHREPEFQELLLSIRRRLLGVYRLDPAVYTAIVISGSGTAANEAVLASCLQDGDRLLVLSNGVYGERLEHMARCLRLSCRMIRYDWGQEIVAADVDRALKEDGFTMIAVVHHETTTGALNNLEEIGQIAGAHGNIRLMVDAVSSFAGEEIEFTRWGLDAITSTANKCIHGVPGVAFAIVKRDLLSSGCLPRSLYLDLANYEKDQSRGIPPFTPPVQAMYALDAALEELEEEGTETRIAKYRRLSEKVRTLAARIGLETFLPQHRYGHTLTSFYLPSGITYEFLHDRLKERGFVIYAGQGRLVSNLFRIANMGNIGEEDIERLFAHLGEILANS